jgi:hypothetical protein
MKLTRKEMLALLSGAALAANSARADGTGTISIVGTADIDGTRRTVGITLVLKDKTWTKAEPGNASFFFTTTRGKYKVAPAPNVVQLLQANVNQNVGQLENLNPDTVKKGDKGPSKGKSNEKPVIFDWEVV